MSGSDVAGGLYFWVVVIGFIIAIRDKEHGAIWRLGCTLGLWIPIGLKRHASGLFTRSLHFPPLWFIVLTFPIGAPFWYLKNGLYEKEC